MPPTPPDYAALARLRAEIRNFLAFSEAAARAAGLEPQQRAPGRPFDHGRFALVEEDLHAPDPGASLSATQRVVRSARPLPVLPE